jgi:hypothetical protein
VTSALYTSIRDDNGDIKFPGCTCHLYRSFLPLPASSPPPWSPPGRGSWAAWSSGPCWPRCPIQSRPAPSSAWPLLHLASSIPPLAMAMVRKPFGSRTLQIRGHGIVLNSRGSQTWLNVMVREPFGSRTLQIRRHGIFLNARGSRTCLNFLDGLCCACFV